MARQLLKEEEERRTSHGPEPPDETKPDKKT
jgi:hypothetical protein